MASTTISTTKDASALDSSTYSWNGKDNHHPCGLNNNGYLWRSFVYFPISFSGWTGVTSATMYLKAHHPTTGIHVYGTTTTTLDVYRMTSDWGEDVGSENVWTTDPNGYSWSTRAGAYTTSNGASITTGQPGDGSWVSIDITNIVKDWFGGAANYGVIMKSSNEGSSATALEWWSREGGYAPYVVINYSTNNPPNAPINLAPTGGAIINSLVPTFTGNSSDPDTGDSMGGYEIQVYNDAQSTLIWDSGSIAASGATSFSKQYAGTALTGNTYYQWRARTYDKAGAWGPYSAFQRFKVNRPPTAPSISISQSPTTDLLTLTPTFNITQNDSDPGDYMAAYRVLLYVTATGSLVWDSGVVSHASGNSVSFTYAGPALSWQTGYEWEAQTTDSNGASSPWSSMATFTTHTTAIPTSLAPTGGTTAASLTPTFTGSRGSTEDTLVSANVQVYDSTGTTLVWDSGTFTSGVTSTAFSLLYAGSVLAYSTTYTWRARVTGSIGGTSAWSALQSFVTPASGSPTQSAPVGSPITTLTPTFTFSRTASYNAYQLIVYEANGTTQHWASGTVSVTSTTSTNYVYAGTALLWNTTYQWKVQLSSDGGSTWGSGWSGLVSFATDSAGLPTLSAPAVNAWLTTLTPTISGTTYNSELATAFRILVYASDQTTLVWDSGDISQAGATTFSTTYSGTTALTNGSVYYVQARYTKSTGPTGNYCALQQFHINAIPSAPQQMTPATGAIIQDSLLPTFTATFADADIANYGDYPTLLEIEVYRQSDNTLFGAFNTSTGLVAGANSIAYPSVGVTALAYETVYIWHARYTDSLGAVSQWSSFQTFKPSQSSACTITAPLATVTVPNMAVSWTFSSPGGKTQHTYQVTVQDSNATLVYDSGVVTSTSTGHTVPAGYLHNGNTYTVALTVADTDGI